jgi:putative DNA modification/repair radical SAM protein
LEFYKRNYIEGLFLSSGVIQSPDYTMEEVIAVAKSLRTDHLFGGYIHLKIPPGASPALIAEAGKWADRLSANIEMPRQADLDRFAPAKNHTEIQAAMGEIHERITEAREDRTVFAAAGQSTQMIVGATEASDSDILRKSSALYQDFGLRRVYYSAFSPIPHSDSRLPPQAAPLVREHRLYQADWLLRFYGFDVNELTTAEAPDLPLDHDPKLAWALRNRQFFPVDVNSADREALLRIPGLGVRSVDRILAMRQHHRFRMEDLARLTKAIERMRFFVTTSDFNPDALRIDAPRLPKLVKPAATQLSLFDSAVTARTGEL